jgi:hypothetical protein
MMGPGGQGGPGGMMGPGGQGGPGGMMGPGGGLNSADDYVRVLSGALSANKITLKPDQKKKILALLQDLPDPQTMFKTTLEIGALLNDNQKTELRNNMHLLRQQGGPGGQPGQPGQQAGASSETEKKALAYLEKRAGNAQAPAAPKVTLPSPGAPPDQSLFVIGPPEIPAMVLYLQQKGGSLELTPSQAAGILQRMKAMADFQKKNQQFVSQIKTILSTEQVAQLQQYMQQAPMRPDPEAISKLKKQLAG